MACLPFRSHKHCDGLIIASCNVLIKLWSYTIHLFCMTMRNIISISYVLN